jgi:fructose/tagatose bisphosphate aldolase
VDLLAVTIGNVHGVSTLPARLDFARLESISSGLPKKFPLVLHGASGLDKSLVLGCLDRGVCKVNINTELRIAALQIMKSQFKNDKV